MSSDQKRTVSRRHLLRALLGRHPEPAPEPGPAPPPDLHADADAAYAEGDYQQAVASYRVTMRDDLSNAAMRARLGHALFEIGQLIQARVELEHALRLTSGRDRFARLVLALALLGLGKADKAAAALAAYDDPDRAALTRTAHALAARLRSGEEADLEAMRAELHAAARQAGVLPA